MSNLISVIVPTYQRIEYLPICINSLLSQYHNDDFSWEAIICNDAGEDVKHIVDSFHDSRLKYISNPINVGLGQTRNNAVKESQGNYICYCDQDDGLYPHFLQIMFHEMKKAEINGYKLIYGDVIRKIQQKGDDKKYKVVARDLPLSIDFNHDLILVQNVTPVTGIFHKRELIDEIGQFDSTLLRYEDWDFLIRAANNFDLKHIAIPVSWFTWRNDLEGTSMSSTPDNLFTTLLPTIYGRYWETAHNKLWVAETMNYVLKQRGLDPMFQINREINPLRL